MCKSLFFFMPKPAYEVRISYLWSAVGSSDLYALQPRDIGGKIEAEFGIARLAPVEQQRSQALPGQKPRQTLVRSEIEHIGAVDQRGHHDHGYAERQNVVEGQSV